MIVKYAKEINAVNVEEENSYLIRNVSKNALKD